MQRLTAAAGRTYRRGMPDGGRTRRIEEWVTTAGTVAGGLAALGGFVYLIGGMVMWLRFKTADLPADQGVAVMSKEQLFVVGLRLMVIPLLVTGTIAILLADRAAKERTGAGPLVRRLATVATLLLAALLLIWAFAVAGWPTGLAMLLDAVVLGGGVAVAITARKRLGRGDEVARKNRGATNDAAENAAPEKAAAASARATNDAAAIVAADEDAADEDRRDQDARRVGWLAPATAVAAIALVPILCFAIPGLRLDDIGARFAVAVGALLAMLLPAVAYGAARLPRPPLPVAVLVIVGASELAAWSIVLGAPWWAAVAIALGAIAIAAVAGPLARRRPFGMKPPAVELSARLRRILVVGLCATALAAWSIVLASEWWVRAAIALGAIVVLGTLAAAVLAVRQAKPRDLHPRWWWLLPALAIVAVGLIVPWSFASATWPLGLGLVIVVWLWRRARLRMSDDRETERRRMLRYMAAAAVVAAAVVSIGRQLDEPVQLLHATVTFKDKTPDVEGAYLNSTSDVVYVGNPTAGTIDVIPRDDVRQVAVGPPEERAPSPSLLSRIVPGERRFSVRPLEFWCDGERYGWFEADSVCETQPFVRWLREEHHRDMDRLGMPIRVQCPLELGEVCRGWVQFRSEEDYLHGRAGIPRPVVPDPVRFAVGGTKTREFCATLTDGQLDLLSDGSGKTAAPAERPRAEGAPEDEEPDEPGIARFSVALTDDAEGETVLSTSDYGLLVERERMRAVKRTASNCQPHLELTTEVKARKLTLSVTARPRAKGIRPWHVEGAVLVEARRLDESATRRHLGKPKLENGGATVSSRLPAGDWCIYVSHRAAHGIAYDRPRVIEAITVGGQKREPEESTAEKQRLRCLDLARRAA